MEKEIWKDIPWYEWKYQVSSLGRVKRLPYKWIHIYKPRWWEKNNKPQIIIEKTAKEKILPEIDLWWYKRVSFSIWGQRKINYLVHRLVYCSFNDLSLKFLWQKTKTLVLHKNDIKSDNRLCNLFLWSQKDNMEDMCRKWRWSSWIKQKMKIWFDDIGTIKDMYSSWMTLRKIAEKYSVSIPTISRAINWITWNWKTQ